MKNITTLRRISTSLALVASVFIMSAQSFTVHLKNGNTTSYNTEDVEDITFSPEKIVPPAEVTTFEDAANTYIVTKAGEYEFYPRLLSGTEIDIVKADWIWAQKQTTADTRQELVSDVRLEDGKVKFTALGNYGNVAIAGFDSEGTVKWVWLIWMTDQPADVLFASDVTFLDRMIGSTGNSLESGIKAWGAVVYQWGRPVPLFGGFGEEYENTVFAEARKWTVMNPKYGFEWKTVEKKVTLEESIANPTTFYLGTKWMEPNNNLLWGETKTDYDPSPAGYQIPCYEWWGSDFFSRLEYADNEAGATYVYNGNSAWFPACNQNRAYDTGENIIGFPGSMCWNAVYTYVDYLGVQNHPNYSDKTLEELYDMGMPIDFFPTRLVLFFKEDNRGGDLGGNAFQTYGLPIRCAKIKK